MTYFAKITTFDNAMKRADGIANKRARAIETRFAAMNKNVSGSLGAAGRGFVALAGVGLGVRGLQELIDAATRSALGEAQSALWREIEALALPVGR